MKLPWSAFRLVALTLIFIGLSRADQHATGDSMVTSVPGQHLFKQPVSEKHSTPKIWFMGGQRPNDYNVTMEIGEHQMKCAHIYTIATQPEAGGSLMQTFAARRYRTKRMRFSALVKTEAVENWAGLWMRINDKGGNTLEFDNMYTRQIKGTRNWQRYFVVLDVPQDSSVIYIGLLLRGKGDLWMAEARFEETTDEVTGDGLYRVEPGNLDFSESE